MWKRILELLWQALHLAEDTQRNRQDIKALEKRFLDFVTESERKAHESQLAQERLTDELKRQREREESERRILKLELENYLLRQNRGMPSVEPKQLPELTTEKSEKQDVSAEKTEA